jgi:hypothetical protein
MYVFNTFPQTKCMLSSFVLQSLQTQCLARAYAHLSPSTSSVPTVTLIFVRQTERSTRVGQRGFSLCTIASFIVLPTAMSIHIAASWL